MWADVIALPVRLERDGFDLPTAEWPHGATVILELRFQTSALGRLFDPFIEVRRGTTEHRQYFERGASGRRFLDLSPHFRRATEAPGGSRVHLRGRLMHWRTEGVLRIFESPGLTDANVLIVAPHPDDAEITAFGMYATRRSWVVTVTAGELGGGLPPLNLSEAESLPWVAMLRLTDSLSVPQLGK